MGHTHASAAAGGWRLASFPRIFPYLTLISRLQGTFFAPLPPRFKVEARLARLAGGAGLAGGEGGQPAVGTLPAPAPDSLVGEALVAELRLLREEVRRTWLQGLATAPLGGEGGAGAAQ